MKTTGKNNRTVRCTGTSEAIERIERGMEVLLAETHRNTELRRLRKEANGLQREIAERRTETHPNTNVKIEVREQAVGYCEKKIHDLLEQTSDEALTEYRKYKARNGRSV